MVDDTMNTEPEGQVTELLHRWRAGDRDAAERLWELTYPELKQIAHCHLRREVTPDGQQTTGLVNETFLKLARIRELDWESRRHFLAFASRSMRRILVDEARRKAATKRKGRHEPLEDLRERLAVRDSTDPLLVLAVDRALEQLQALDARQARLVELRFFGGFSVEESAEQLGISARTAAREWQMARAWLRQAIRERGHS